MIFVVLTVHDQADSLPGLLARLEALDLPLRVIVVDDASTDGSASVVQQFEGLAGRLHLVQHVRRHGAGRCLAVGLRLALTMGADPDDAVVTLPPGASPDLTPLLRMYRLLAEGSDLVIASRFTPGGGEDRAGGWGRLLSHLFSQVLRILFPIAGVTDYTSGFRGLRLAVVRRAFEIHGRDLVTCSGDSGVAELLIRLGRMGVRAAEVPLVLGPEAAGPRRFTPWALLGYLRMILVLLTGSSSRRRRPSR